jgi:competence protein ComEC
VTTPDVTDGETLGSENARRLSTRLPRVPSVASVWRALAREAQAQVVVWPLWAPVALGGGAALYFGLRTEPPLALALALPAVALLVTALAWRRTPRAAGVALALLTCFAMGIAVAKTRTIRVSAPIVPELGAVRIDGWVVDVAPPTESGQRLLIAPVAIEDLAVDALPHRIRVTVAPEALIGPGASIRLTASLGPPPPPAAPGAYDFARGAWFDGIGGVGFDLVPPQLITLPDPPWEMRLLLAVNEARWRLTLRVQEAIGGPAGGIAAAMITGQSAFVPIDTSEAMRDAGISHIVSISGLHMAIVGGFVFFAVRLAIAATPAVALRINGKKAAAIAGLLAVGAYLVTSGAPPAAERAAVTAGVAFLAILAERRAVSLRGLALAACLIILSQPEAVTEPGFQMSFAATTALVALAEAWPRPTREINTPGWIRAIQGSVQWVALSIGISFVAGTATAPFVIQHFNRVAIYSLPANLLTAPLSSFVFMPTLAIGAALAPIGLGGPFLAVAGWGIGLMLSLAERVASWPGAAMVIASGPAWTLPASFVGILWICLWKGHGRWLGIPAALAVFLAPKPPVPDLWIAADGGAIAVADEGRAWLMRPDSRRFASDLWARRRGLQIVEDEAELGGRFDCSRWGCATRIAQTLQVAGWWTRRAPKPEQLAALCRADVVVLKGDWPCAARLTLRPADFARRGAAELYREGEGWRIVWANDLRGHRPWTRSAP